MPLTIVRAMPFFDPAIQFGGVISQSREITRRLVERGHRVFVATTDNGQPDTTPRDQWLDRDGYRIFYAHTSAWHRVVPYWTPMLHRPLTEILPGADVLQLNVGLTLTNHLGRKLARKHQVPYIYNAEGCLCPTRLKIKQTQKKLFLRYVERPILRDAGALQALTEKDARDLTHNGAPRDRVHVIPNGVEPLPAPTPQESQHNRATARRQFGIPADAPLILFLGRIHQIKGLDTLLATISQSTRDDIWLLVAGPDEDGTGARSEQLAQTLGLDHRVRFVGSLDGDAKEAAFSAADLFALTSRTEGLPMSVLEACARGLPCLLTEECNVPEVQAHGAGLVRRHDPEALTSALDDMLADADRLAAMGQAGRQLIADRFSLNRVVDALESVYESLSHQPGRT